MLKHRFLFLVAASLLGGAIATLPGSGQAQDATPVVSPAVGERATAIVVSATNDPLRVSGSDGVDHLEYDLLVTNAFVAPVTLTSIAVTAPDGETLLRLEGDALVTATQPLIGRTPTAEIPASGTVAVVMDVTVPPDRAVESLSHQVAYKVAPDAPVRSLIGSFTVDGPQLPVDPLPTTIIAPPVRGDGWFANSGCCAAESIHRAIRVPVDGARIGKQETFAIDFARLRDGEPFSGDGARPEDWYGFGAEVLAVADGTVVAVADGYPEQAPLQAITHITKPEDFGGNSVVLEIAPGVYADYAHLQPGSITVAVGDQVTTGQVLGLLGNTGNSSGPHLHFGLIDDPDPLVGNSLPMAFDHWTLQGTFDLDAYDAADGMDALSALSLKEVPEPQDGTLQLYLDVADFG
jgi:Peptidase family M23